MKTIADLNLPMWQLSSDECQVLMLIEMMMLKNSYYFGFCIHLKKLREKLEKENFHGKDNAHLILAIQLFSNRLDEYLPSVNRVFLDSGAYDLFCQINVINTQGTARKLIRRYWITQLLHYNNYGVKTCQSSSSKS